MGISPPKAKVSVEHDNKGKMPVIYDGIRLEKNNSSQKKRKNK